MKESKTDPIRFLQIEAARLRQENREMKEELAMLRSSVRALSALQDIVQRMTPDSDLIHLLDDLLAAALAVVDASDGSLLLLDDETEELVFAVVRGSARNQLTGFRLPPGKGIAGWVADTRKPLVIHDVRNDSRFYPQVDETFGFQTQTLACVPLLDGDRILGVIEAINKVPGRPFTAEDNDLLMVLAQLASAAITRAEEFAERRT